MWITLDLSVRAASAHNAYCVYGHPSPMAFIGFAHALCARSGLRQAGGVLAVLADYRPRSVKVFGSHQFTMLRSTERDVDGVSQVDVPRADLDVSLAFEVDTGPSFDSGPIFAPLPAMRFAGGSIVEHHLKAHDSSEDAFRGLRGFVMKADELTPSDDPISALLEHVSIKEKGHGWRTPTLRGLRLIEPPRKRGGSRGGHAHAYADPLIGAVHFESARKATEADLWRIDRRGNLFHFITD